MLRTLRRIILDRIPPATALRWLFRLDNRLYNLQTHYAIVYGNGTHTKHRHMRYHDFFVERVQPGERVLDIGCGIGAVAHDVAARAGASVVGIDLEETNIARARSQFAHPQVEYLVGDVLQALPNESFDVAILSNVLEHLPNRPEFLRKVQATIHPQRILIRVPLFERDWRVPLKQEVGVDWRLDPTHEIEYTQEIFTEEMTAAELQIAELQVHWGEIWAVTIPDTLK